MHRALAGRPWRTAGAIDAAVVPTLRLRSASKAHTGSKVAVRWTAAGAGSVAQWRVSLDGRVLRTVSVTRTSFTRRITRTGRHTWRVVGFGADGSKIVAATRDFRVVR